MATVTKELCISGNVHNCNVIIKDNLVIVLHDKTSEELAKRTVEGLADFIKKQRGIYLQWATTEDFNILGIVSKDDDFGYFLNVEAPDLSEWGYTAPAEQINEAMGFSKANQSD